LDRNNFPIGITIKIYGCTQPYLNFFHQARDRLRMPGRGSRTMSNAFETALLLINITITECTDKYHDDKTNNKQ
jgi:hypothetical protein